MKAPTYRNSTHDFLLLVWTVVIPLAIIVAGLFIGYLVTGNFSLRLMPSGTSFYLQGNLGGLIASCIVIFLTVIFSIFTKTRPAIPFVRYSKIEPDDEYHSLSFLLLCVYCAAISWIIMGSIPQ